MVNQLIYSVHATRDRPGRATRSDAATTRTTGMAAKKDASVADGTKRKRTTASFSDEGASVLRPPRFNFNFERLPRFLRVGPWSPVAYAVILAYALALVWSFPKVFPDGFVADDGIAERYAIDEGDRMATVRRVSEGAGILWTLGVLYWLVSVVGWYVAAPPACSTEARRKYLSRRPPACHESPPSWPPRWSVPSESLWILSDGFATKMTNVWAIREAAGGRIALQVLPLYV